jgi:hypothetical protein
MPSPRSRFETACRIGAFGLLGWLLGGSLMPASGRRIERANGDELAAHLAEWTRAAGNVGVHATLDGAPEPATTEWLSALRRSGRQVTWSGNPPAAAMSVEPVADPNGGTRIDIEIQMAELESTSPLPTASRSPCAMRRARSTAYT